MTTFRHKPDKIKYLTSINTLDTIHRKHVHEFESKRNKTNDVKGQITKLEEQLLQFEKTSGHGDMNTVDDIKQRSNLKCAIQKLKRDLYDIENNVSELEYYSQTN